MSNEVENLRQMGEEELFSLAVLSLASLNRLAKKKRDRINKIRERAEQDKPAASDFALRRAIDRIYEHKNAFLDAAVRAGRATVGVYSIVQDNGMTCNQCGSTWFGGDWCRRCKDRSGTPQRGPTPWYLVQIGEQGWHQPDNKATPAMRIVAKPIEPHDPHQPQREIPDVGLRMDGQFAAVRLATERLLAEITVTTTIPDASQPDPSKE
jgi:hypothetical protein